MQRQLIVQRAFYEDTKDRNCWENCKLVSDQTIKKHVTLCGVIMANKYIYYKVIQTNHGFGWDDDDFHETDSRYWPKDRPAYLENKKLYRQNIQGSMRVINRRELREQKN